MTPAPRRHLHLDAGPLHLDYQGPAEQVVEIAAELAAVEELTVRVDDEVHDDQLPLPYARLWDRQPSITSLQEPEVTNSSESPSGSNPRETRQ